MFAEERDAVSECVLERERERERVRVRESSSSRTHTRDLEWSLLSR